ncbi:hypothetical protein N0V86_004475 [Didymella sp. IMI 355093]|nr:hypothetical protein N0V86_004475 [Didymella sp. IMI 355093]
MKRRGRYVLDNGPFALLKLHCKRAGWTLLAATATQTAWRLRCWLDNQPLSSTYCYDCDKDLNDGYANNVDCSAYAVDRIVEFWHTFSLSVRDWKTVDYASMLLTDAAMFDVDRSVGALKTLIKIPQVAYRLGDQAFTNAALTSLRSQCLDGRFSVN